MKRAREFCCVAISFCCIATSARARAQAPAPELQAQLAQSAQSAAPGQVAASTVFSAALDHKKPASFPIALEGGRCYTVLGVGGAGVKELDLWLFDPVNQKVAAEKRSGTLPQLRYCAQWPGTYRVQVEAKHGAGPVAVQAFAPPPQGYAQTSAPPNYPPPSYPPTSAPPNYPPPNAPNYPPAASAPPNYAPPPSYAPASAPVARAPRDPLPPDDPLAATVDHEASIVAPASRRMGDFLRGAASGHHGLTDWTVNLESGKCYTVVAAGGPGVETLYLFLWSPNGRRVGEARPRAAVVALSHCALFTGPHRLEAKTARGAGELRAAIYAQ